MNLAHFSKEKSNVRIGGVKRPILYVLIPFCAGIAACGIFKIPLAYSIVLSTAFIAIATLSMSSAPLRVRYEHRTVSHVALFLAIFFSGMAAHLNSNILAPGHIANFIPVSERNSVYVRGTIVDDPVATTTLYKTVRTSFTLKAGKMGTVPTSVRLQSGDSPHFSTWGTVPIFPSWQKVNGLVKVDIYSKKATALHFGNEVILEGEISRPHGLNNPGLFNYADYLAMKNIYCCLRVKEGDAIKNRDSPHLGKTPTWGTVPIFPFSPIRRIQDTA